MFKTLCFKKNLLFAIFIGFFSLEVFAGEGVSPQVFSVPKIFDANSSCHNLKEPVKAELLRMREQGHKMVMLLSGGSNLSIPRHRIKDEINGQTYSNINDYVANLEAYIATRLQYSSQFNVHEQTKKCLLGQRMDPALKDISCVSTSKTIFTHIAFVVLDKKIHVEPFMIHFYGNEKFNFLKPDIRIETFDSFMTESRFSMCQVGIMTLQKKSANLISSFLYSNNARRLLSKGNKSYNLLSNPWKNLSQNCNTWLSEVLATSLYLNKKYWPKVNRSTAKKILLDTDFRPIKVSLTELQALIRLPAIFANGIDINEGNIDHDYLVADIVPARAVTEWIARNGHFKNMTYIQGNP